MDIDYSKNYYYDNINNFRQYTKKYYDLKRLDTSFNKERALYLKNYYEHNRDYLKAYMKVYYYENKKDILEKQKIYRLKNKQKIRDYHRKRYYNKNYFYIKPEFINKKTILNFD